MADTKTSIAIGADGSQAIQALNQVGAAADQTTDRLTKMGDGGDKAAQKLATQVANIQRALDPAGAAAQRAAKDVDVLTAAMEKQIISLDVGNDLIAKRQAALELTINSLSRSSAATVEATATTKAMAGAHDAATGSAGKMREAMVLFHEFLRGDWKRGVGSATIELQNFGLMQPIIAAATSPVGLGLAAVGAAFGTMALAARAGAKEQESFDVALATTGAGLGITRQSAYDLADGIAASSAMTETGARAMVLSLSKVSGLGKDALVSVAEQARDFGVATGTDAATAATNLGKALADPLRGLNELDQVTHIATVDLREHVQQLVEQGRVMEAATAIASANEAALKGLADRGLGPFGRAWEWIDKTISHAWESLKQIGQDTSLEKQAQAAAAKVKEMQAAVAGYDGGPTVVGKMGFMQPASATNAAGQRGDQAGLADAVAAQHAAERALANERLLASQKALQAQDNVTLADLEKYVDKSGTAAVSTAHWQNEIVKIQDKMAALARAEGDHSAEAAALQIALDKATAASKAQADQNKLTAQAHDLTARSITARTTAERESAANAEADFKVRAELAAGKLTQDQAADEMAALHHENHLRRLAADQDAADKARAAADREAEQQAARDAAQAARDAAAIDRDAKRAQADQKATDDAQNAIFRQIDDLKAEAAAVALSDKARAELTQTMKAENELRKAGLVLTEQDRQSIIAATDALYDEKAAREAEKKAAEEHLALLKKGAEEQARTWSDIERNALQGFQTDAVNALEGAFGSNSKNSNTVKNFFNSLEQLAIKTAAQMAVAMMFKSDFGGGLLNSLGFAGSGSSSSGGPGLNDVLGLGKNLLGNVGGGITNALDGLGLSLGIGQDVTAAGAAAVGSGVLDAGVKAAGAGASGIAGGLGAALSGALPYVGPALMIGSMLLNNKPQQHHDARAYGAINADGSLGSGVTGGDHPNAGQIDAASQQLSQLDTVIQSLSTITGANFGNSGATLGVYNMKGDDGSTASNYLLSTNATKGVAKEYAASDAGLTQISIDLLKTADGLSATTKTIIDHTKAQTTAALSADLAFGKSFDTIDQQILAVGQPVSTFKSELDQLSATFTTQSATAKALGLDVGKLTSLYNAQQAQLVTNLDKGLTSQLRAANGTDYLNTTQGILDTAAQNKANADSLGQDRTAQIAQITVAALDKAFASLDQDALRTVKAAYSTNVTVIGEANKALAALSQAAQTAAMSDSQARIFTLQIQNSGQTVQQFTANMQATAAAFASASAAASAQAQSLKDYAQALTIGGLSPLSGAAKATQAALLYKATPTTTNADAYLTATKDAYGASSDIYGGAYQSVLSTTINQAVGAAESAAYNASLSASFQRIADAGGALGAGQGTYDAASLAGASAATSFRASIVTPADSGAGGAVSIDGMAQLQATVAAQSQQLAALNAKLTGLAVATVTIDGNRRAA